MHIFGFDHASSHFLGSFLFEVQADFDAKDPKIRVEAKRRLLRLCELKVILQEKEYFILEYLEF